MSNQSWFLLKDLLTTEEQLSLFNFIHETDATDRENLPSCMNPSPKTMELAQPDGTSSRTLYFNSKDDNIVLNMVKKAISSVGKHQHQSISSLSMAVIRYCPPGTNPRIGSRFPPHIDHCNDGSWVVLFSLGCTAIFQIKCPDTEKETFDMNSGDVLVFDPSSQAGVLHGVDEVRHDGELSTEWTGIGEKAENMIRCSRFGVQCRVSFDKGNELA